MGWRLAYSVKTTLDRNSPPFIDVLKADDVILAEVTQLHLD